MNSYDYNGTLLSYAETVIIERFTNSDNVALFNRLAGPGAPKIAVLNEAEYQIAIKLTQQIHASIQSLICEDHKVMSKYRNGLGFNAIVEMFPDEPTQVNKLHDNIWTAIKMLQLKDNTAEDIPYLRSLVWEAGDLLWEKEVAAAQAKDDTDSKYLLGISAFYRLVQERLAKTGEDESIDQGVWSLADDTMGGRPELAYLVLAGLDVVLAAWAQYDMELRWYAQWQHCDPSAAMFQGQLSSEMNEFVPTDGVIGLSASPLVGAAQPLPVV